MIDDAQLSRSMSVYVETFAEPDDETTSRMRDRVTGYVVAEQQRRRGRQRLLALSAGLALAAVGFGAYLLGRSDTQPQVALASGGKAGQRVEIPDLGVLELRPGAQVRFHGELAQGGFIELLAGELRVAHDGPGALSLRSGEYELACEACAVQVRHTGSLPVVGVDRGRARLSGPDLPIAGVWLAPLGPEEK